MKNALNLNPGAIPRFFAPKSSIKHAQTNILTITPPFAAEQISADGPLFAHRVQVEGSATLYFFGMRFEVLCAFFFRGG